MGLDGENGKSLETVRAIRLRGNYIPVIMVAENEKFYKEAFEVFAFNYLTKPVKEKAERRCIFITELRFIHSSITVWRTYPAASIM